MNDYEDFFFDEDDRKRDEGDRQMGIYGYTPAKYEWEGVNAGGGNSQGEAANTTMGGNAQDVLANTGQGGNAQDVLANTGQGDGQAVVEGNGGSNIAARAGMKRERDNNEGWEDLMDGFTADEAKVAVANSVGTGLGENDVAPSSVNNVADYTKAGNVRAARVNAMRNVGGEGEGLSADAQSTGAGGEGGGADAQSTGAGGEGGGGAAVGTTGLGRGWNEETSQRWDDLQNYLKRMDEEENKGRKRNAWWELMARGLVGSANLYGTTQGAPALDLSGSKDAFSDTDAYARLKEKKTDTKNLVMKQIENMEKQRETERKLSDSERNYQLKVQNLENQKLKLEMAKDKAADEKTKSTYDIEIKKIEAQIKQAEADHIATKQQLEDELLRTRAYRNMHPTSGSGKSGGKSKSGSKGTYLEIGDKSYTIPTGRKDWFVQQCKKAKIYGDNYNKMINWISDHPNDPKVKKLQEFLGI